MRSLAILLACCLLLAGCFPPGFLLPRTGKRGGAMPDLVGYVGERGKALSPALRGSVTFAARSTQGTLEEVAVGATVSLINTGSNQTVVTGLTDAAGNFVLELPRGYRPDATTVYFLEAVKGIGGNLPGSPAVRVRTLARYQAGGWVTLSSATPNAGILLSPSSTALAVCAALLKAAGRPLSLDQLIGRLSGSDYSPVDGLSLQDFEAARDIISACLADRQDPIASIVFNTATSGWERTGASGPALAISAVEPASGVPGDEVTFVGQGFGLAAGAVARFNGAPQTAVAVSATSLKVIVPASATSGQTTLQVGNLIALGPNFTVPVRITSLSQVTAAGGSSLTVHGSGFDPSALGNNEVRFGGAVGTVTAVAPNALTVTVPSSALAGPISVSVLGSVADSAETFYPTLSLTAFTPSTGAPGTPVTIAGTGFHATGLLNQVRFGSAAVTDVEVQPGYLLVKVPQAAVSGPIEVTVNGKQVQSAGSFVLAGENAPYANATIEPVAGTMKLEGTVQATNWPISATDVAVDPLGTRYLATAEGVLKVTSSGMASLEVRPEELDNRSPQTVACDSQCNVYIGTQNRLYRYAPGLGVTLLAGNGSWEHSGDWGSAVLAGVASVSDIAVDQAGNVCFIEGNRIRKIDASGIIITVAGDSSAGYGGDGGAADSAQLRSPSALCFDASDYLYIADAGNGRIRRIDTNGVISSVVGNGAFSNPGDGSAGSVSLVPMGLAFGTDGLLYVSDMLIPRIRAFNPSNGTVVTRVSAGASYLDATGTPSYLDGFHPVQLAGSPDGEILVDETKRVLAFNPYAGSLQLTIGNETSEFGGDGGAALKARLGRPEGIALDAAKNLYVADTRNHRLRKIDPNGVISTIAGNGTRGTAFYDGMPAIHASLGSPTDVAVDAQGRIYVSCADDHRVWRIDTAGRLHVFAGNGSSGYGGDGSEAVWAQLASPQAICLDPDGYLLVADTGNGRIRKVDLSGFIQTIAGDGTPFYSGDGTYALATGIGSPFGVACDGTGQIYLSDRSGHTIRRLNLDGTMQTIAGQTDVWGFGGDGGPANQAMLAEPTRLVCSGTALYFTDSGNHCIRQVDATGVITTVAGMPQQQGYGNEGGSAIGARMSWPMGLALDTTEGRLFVADSENNRIRSIR